ncbi:hypothetical protein MPSEU_000963500 [Mayamaea pseudoterrestris]|nr:hypothetical protein MPSEU_000963500 [Mayamaea pseudoterrestris]
MPESRQWSTIVPHTSRSDRGNIRRAWDPLVHPELGLHGCHTLYEGFRRGAKLHPLGPCMGFRAISTSGFATPYIYSSYTECLARVNAIAAGLDVLNLVQANEDDGLKILGIYMKNCMEWVLSEHAAYTIGGCTAPFYDTLGPETVQFILTQTGLTSVISTRAELASLCAAKQTGLCPNFEYIILVDGVTPQAEAMTKQDGLQVISLAKVEATGAARIAASGHKHSPPKSDDVATFCYTSGTTGDPKGALMTHRNFVSTAAGMHRVISDSEPHMFDRHLSYLPLAHIFERVVSAQLLMAGGSIAFYRGDPTLLIEDLQACRPTMLPVAPRVLNKIFDKIHAGIASTGGMKKKIFDAALAAKTEGLKHGRLAHPLYDRLLFNKIKKGLGMDYVRFMVSGSAPLSENVMTFYRCLLGVGVVEGYGQTEGTAGGTISHPDDITTVGHVGGPTGACEICLFDVPEMGYLHTDRDHHGAPCEGRGEICLRGPNVFKGYYKDEEKSREAIDEEGWLHSGDIGLWRPNGTLQIIDRKKNIFKLSQGEYVAPEKIENILNLCPLIAQSFVYGDSKESFLVAIVVPDEESVRHWAKEHEPSLVSASAAEMCQSRTLNDAILKLIQSKSKDHKLPGFEIVRAVYLEPSPFTVEQDLMTPTFKLKRNKIRDLYEKQIRELYKKGTTLQSKL